MTVYVDDMRAPFGRMVMCHMIADTREELFAMADKIGVARKWLQMPETYREHFDISLSKRALAVQAGAMEVTRQELVRHTLTRRDKTSAAYLCYTAPSVADKGGRGSAKVGYLKE